MSRFEREVDPDGVLSPQERARRADHAKSAYYARLALKSAKARRARREADQLVEEVVDELSDVDGAAA